MTLDSRLRTSGASEPSTTDPSSGSPPAKLKFRKVSEINQIQRAGKEIIARYQRIEEAWKMAEEKLAMAHVPVDVKIMVGEGSIGRPDHVVGDYREFLGYVKMKNQWRICLIREEKTIFESVQPEDQYECKPITECPVHVRLDMINWFPKLCQEVIRVTKEFVPVIEEKVAAFEKTLQALGI